MMALEEFISNHLMTVKAEKKLNASLTGLE